MKAACLIIMEFDPSGFNPLVWPLWFEPFRIWPFWYDHNFIIAEL